MYGMILSPIIQGLYLTNNMGIFFGDSAAATWLYPRMIVGGLLRIMVKFTIPKKNKVTSWSRLARRVRYVWTFPQAIRDGLKRHPTKIAG